MSSNELMRFWQSRGESSQVTAVQAEELRNRFGVAEPVRPIAHAPGYAVSRDGRVFSFLPCSWSKDCPRELRPIRHAYNYRMVRLHVNKKSAPAAVHRLVAEAFLPPPAPAQNVVRHLDGNPANNHADNLAWGTQADNMQDAIRHGTSLKGNKNPNAKLTPRRVRIIRDLTAEGFRIAHLLGVNPQTVRLAASREQWAHVAEGGDV
jgi:hypothetical protein